MIFSLGRGSARRGSGEPGQPFFEIAVEFQLGEDFFGPVDDVRRDSGELGDIDAVAVIR